MTELSPDDRAIIHQCAAQAEAEAHPNSKHKFANPGTLEVFLTARRAGLSILASCEAARIDDATYRRWRLNAEANPEGPHARFAELLKSHHRAAQLEALERIRRASDDPKHWTAQAWILERTDQQQFAIQRDQDSGPRVIVQVGTGMQDVKVAVVAMSPSSDVIDATPLAALPPSQAQHDHAPAPASTATHQATGRSRPRARRSRGTV